METSGKQCYNCKYLDRYYTKETKHYRSTQYGWCCKTCGNRNIHESCESYASKPRQKRCNFAIKHCLNDILTELSEIRNLIGEEDEESM